MSPHRKARHLYKRDGVYWGCVVIAGRRHRKSLDTCDAREARSRVSAWITAILDDKPAPLMFADVALQWAQRHLPASVKPSTATRYATSAKRLCSVMGSVPIDQITAVVIGRYIASRSGTVTNATIRRDLTALSRLLAWCIMQGWRDDNPARFYDRTIIRERRLPIRPPDPADVVTVIEAAPLGMARILRLLDATGMRENEGVMLTRRQVDPASETITLIHTKGNMPRTINWKTPGGDAASVLAEGQSDGAMFRTEGGDQYRNFSSNFARVIRDVADRERGAGRPFRRFRVHDLRHGFAIRALKRGMSIYALSHHLGHTSVKTTEIYLAFLTFGERQRVIQGAIR